VSDRALVRRHPGGGVREALSGSRVRPGDGQCRDVLSQPAKHQDEDRRRQQDLGRDAAKLPDNPSKEQLDAAQEETTAALSERGLLYRFLSEKLSTIEQMSKIDRSYPRTIDFGMAVVKKPDELPEYYVDHSSIIASITVPVLVISGTKDYAVGPEQYKTFRFPHQTVVQLDSGHLPYYENTAEFAAAIRRFVVGLRPAP
jgi:proline iminopeptidase